MTPQERMNLDMLKAKRGRSKPVIEPVWKKIQRCIDAASVCAIHCGMPVNYSIVEAGIKLVTGVNVKLYDDPLSGHTKWRIMDELPASQ